ncbi:molecular chaperone [Porphyrobacter sp. AAP60]|uniref:fimbrial biogenesis chaperone n=1 Tax=Porphyrobacter sp. AAP60 TaxID=1523423 RepID=UPI000A70A3AB|nr:fimbria/pilus periplasmic chaperone [Porphyrobacter sp. AAP60]
MRRSIFHKCLTWLALACGFMGLLQPQVALAGSLTVLPIRVEVAANRQFCSVTIGNDGTKDVAVQVRGYRWHQEDGTDALDESQSIAINPSIMMIAPGAKKLVRCSLPEQSGPIESTYRLIVSELPRAEAEPGTLQTLLQLSIPVFRAQPDARPSLHWEATEDGRLLVTNSGTRHVRIADLVVHPATAAAPVRAKAGFYLLAGASRTVDADFGKIEIAEVEAMTEDGAFVAVLPGGKPRT